MNVQQTDIAFYQAADLRITDRFNADGTLGTRLTAYRQLLRDAQSFQCISQGGKSCVWGKGYYADQGRCFECLDEFTAHVCASTQWPTPTPVPLVATMPTAPPLTPPLLASSRAKPQSIPEPPPLETQLVVALVMTAVSLAVVVGVVSLRRLRVYSTVRVGDDDVRRAIEEENTTDAVVDGTTRMEDVAHEDEALQIAPS